MDKGIWNSMTVLWVIPMTGGNVGNFSLSKSSRGDSGPSKVRKVDGLESERSVGSGRSFDGSLPSEGPKN